MATEVEEDVRNLLTPQKARDKDRLTPKSLGSSKTSPLLALPAKKVNSRSQSRLTTITCADSSDNKTSPHQQVDKSINIRFSLASASSWSKGYASIHGGHTDSDREEILKKCVRLFQSSKRSINQEDTRKSEGTCDYSLLFYGSNGVHSNNSKVTAKTRLGTRPLNKKQPTTLDDVQAPKIPNLEPSDTEEEKELLQTVTHCKTTVIHYKSGRVAIVRFQVVSCLGNCNHPACYSTLVFDDVPGSKVLLAFQPDGTGCCHFKNGQIKLFFGVTDGYVFSEHGEVLHHWQWGRNQQLPTITHQVTAQVCIRSAGQSALGLVFKCDSHTFKFNISSLPPRSKAGCYMQQGKILPHASKKEKLLKTSGPFLSSYAKELVKGDSSKHKAKLTQDKETLQKEEFRKSLEMPEKVRFGHSTELILLQLKRKARHIIDGWMEHYQVVIGLRPKEMAWAMNQKGRTRQLRRTHSAVMINPDSPSQMKDLGLMPVSNNQEAMKVNHRLPSAPPGFVSESVDGTNEEANRKEVSLKEIEKAESPTMENDTTLQTHAIKALEHVSKTADKLRVCCGSSIRSRPSELNQNQEKTIPQLTGASKRPRRRVITVLGIPCTPALRRYMTTLATSNHVFCRCSVSFIPQITDLEYDQFIYRETNNKQMIVVAVVSSRFPESSPGLQMLERVYQRQNRNRRHPCVESKTDMFRVLQYDINKAAGEVENRRPLLLTRHNVVPGMVLIYCHGNLLFCDHIFNGYGCAEDDFRHQLRQCHTRALKSFSLPRDFRFSPARGKQGIRTPWGGEIGGAGVDFHGHPGLDVWSVPPISTRASTLSPKLPNVNSTDKRTTNGCASQNKQYEDKDCKEKTGNAGPLLARRRTPTKNDTCPPRVATNSTLKNIMLLRNNSRYSSTYATGSQQRQILPQVVVTEQK